MKKRLETKLITPLVWLLLLCSSQIRVESQETIQPKLLLNHTEIDICKDNIEKGFVLSIDLGKPIYKTDSLFVATIWIAYKKDKILLDGYLKLGTLFEQFNNDNIIFRKDTTSTVYDYVKLEGMNITQAVSGSNMKLVHFTGKILFDTIDCADLKIDMLDLGKDFKYEYPIFDTDSTTICLVSKNLPDRRIDFRGIENSYTIDSLEDTLRIDYFVNVSNKKNLSCFNVELNISDEYAENIKFLDIITDSKIEKITDTHCIIKVDIDTANVNNIKILTAEIIRKKDESSDNVIHCEINNINENACSMNGDIKNITLKINKKTSILEEINEDISILNNEHNIILKSVEEIKLCKLIDIYGLEVNYGMSMLGQNEVLFDKTKLAKGVYFVRILTSNKMGSLQNIKLIIN